MASIEKFIIRLNEQLNLSQENILMIANVLYIYKINRFTFIEQPSFFQISSHTCKKEKVMFKDLSKEIKKKHNYDINTTYIKDIYKLLELSDQKVIDLTIIKINKK